MKSRRLLANPYCIFLRRGTSSSSSTHGPCQSYFTKIYSRSMATSSNKHPPVLGEKWSFENSEAYVEETFHIEVSSKAIKTIVKFCKFIPNSFQFQIIINLFILKLIRFGISRTVLILIRGNWPASVAYNRANNSAACWKITGQRNSCWRAMSRKTFSSNYLLVSEHMISSKLRILFIFKCFVINIQFLRRHNFVLGCFLITKEEWET